MTLSEIKARYAEQRDKERVTLPGTDIVLYVTSPPLSVALDIRDALAKRGGDDDERSLADITMLSLHGLRQCLLDEHGETVFDSDEGEAFLKQLPLADANVLIEAMVRMMATAEVSEGNL